MLINVPLSIFISSIYTSSLAYIANPTKVGPSILNVSLIT